MRKFTSFMFLLFVCLGVNAQRTFFSCDFNNGIPEDFALYDMDGNTPSADAKKNGFEVGQSWISCSVLADKSNLSIMSTSSYAPTGTSDDWIVTPAINVESEYAYFTWDAANLSNKKDGYKILVSTKGQTVDDFADAAVLYKTTTGESKAGYFFTHIASLQEYAGKTIYIALVNNSTNKSFLIMDNLWVGEIYQVLDFENTTSNVLDRDNGTTISCSLLNNQMISFKNDVVVTLNVDGETYTKKMDALSLISGKTKDIKFTEVSVPAPAEGESRNYTLTLTYKTEPLGDVEKTINSALHRLGSTLARKVVIEEATGTWCGYCPRGAVGMNTMREKYPTDFIGIAVHNDIMEVGEYMQGVNSYISGFPSGLVNRSVVVDPSAANLERQYAKEILKPSIATLKINKAEFGDEDSTAIRVNISSSFAFNSERAINNFRYAFVVIENDVKGTTDDYSQANYYSGGGSGKMGGFESLPNPVPASNMVYQEVARGISSSFMGIERSVPQEVVKDQVFTYEYTFVTPQAIMNKNNIEVIALLIDQTTGEIWNADKIEAKDMGYDASISEIGEIQSVEEFAKIYAVDGTLLITLNTESISPARIEIYGLDGKKVKDMYYENVLDGISVPVGDLKGIYIVKVNNGRSVAVKKVIL